MKLLQLPTHPRDLQGLMVAELILPGEGWLRLEQGHKEKLQGGHGDSGAA